MHEFVIRPNGFKEFQKAIIIRMCFVVSAVILLIFFLPWLMGDRSTEVSSSTWITLLMLLAVMVFSLFRKLKTQKAQLFSYKLIITEESISRELSNTPTITILKKDVQEIIQNANGTITIISDSKLNAIGVLSQMERKEELYDLLAEITPITINTTNHWFQRFQWPVSFGVVGLMLATFYVSNRYLSTMAGVIFIGFMIFSFIIVQKSKNTDSRTKRLSYFILLPVLAVVGAIVIKWMI